MTTRPSEPTGCRGRRLSGYGIGGTPATMQAMTQQKMIVFKM